MDKLLVSDIDFYLKLRDVINGESDEYKFIKYITLHDDLFSYFNDMLLWIPSKVYTGVPIPLGDNAWGITIINPESQVIFSHILSGLIEIFSVAPENISLTGNYTTGADGEGYYEKLDISKADLLAILNGLNECVSIMNDKGNYFIHLGI